MQESSQCTPAALIFERELCTPVDLVFGSPPEPDIAGGPELDYFRRLKDRLSTVHQLAREALEDAGARQMRAYDNRAHGPTLRPGDRVWVFYPQRKRGLSPKLTHHWQGPIGRFWTKFQKWSSGSECLDGVDGWCFIRIG